MRNVNRHFLCNFAEEISKTMKTPRKRFLALALLLFISSVCCDFVAAQTATAVLQAARRTNEYFMNRYADPTQATFVRRMRESNLWCLFNYNFR